MRGSKRRLLYNAKLAYCPTPRNLTAFERFHVQHKSRSLPPPWDIAKKVPEPHGQHTFRHYNPPVAVEGWNKPK
jgi:hypothetical protein